jgi:hypothetical protein
MEMRPTWTVAGAVSPAPLVGNVIKRMIVLEGCAREGAVKPLAAMMGSPMVQRPIPIVVETVLPAPSSKDASRTKTVRVTSAISAAVFKWAAQMASRMARRPTSIVVGGASPVRTAPFVTREPIAPAVFVTTGCALGPPVMTGREMEMRRMWIAGGAVKRVTQPQRARTRPIA